MTSQAHSLIEALGFKIQKEGPNRRYPAFKTYASEGYLFWASERLGLIDFGVQPKAGTRFTDQTVADLELFGFKQSVRKLVPNPKPAELYVSLPLDTDRAVINATAAMAIIERLRVSTEKA